MRLFFAHFLFQLREIIRYPAYMISTLLFPSLFFFVFAAPNIEDAASANDYATSFSAFGILGVVFFQFAISVSSEKSSGWESVLRTLPAGRGVRTLSRIGLVLSFALLSSVLVMVTAALSVPLSLSVSKILLVLVVQTLASVPFALAAIALAYPLSAQSALPVVNMVYLILSFSGGLWLPPDALPGFLQVVSPLLPTRHLGEIGWAMARGEPLPIVSLLALAGFGILFGLVAYIQQRKFEIQTYR